MKTFLCVLAFAAVLSLSVVATGCRSSDEAATGAAKPPATAEPVSSATAGSAPTAEEETAADDATTRARFIPVVRGTARLGYRRPATKVEGDMVVTTFRVKNLSSRAIAGLKVEEFWRDKAGNLSGGSSEQIRKPLAPGETATLRLQTPRSPRLYRNQYRFRHAYGEVKVELLKDIE